MKTIATLAVAVILSGCGTYGEPLLLARIYDRNDPCQSQNYNIKPPSFCGASSGRTVIYSTPRGEPIGAAIGYIKKN